MRIPLCTLLLCMLLPGAAAAAPDDDFLAAREAFRVGDAARLDRYAPGLKGYILEPYVSYWQLKLRLNDAQPAEVRALLARLSDGPMSDRLRTDWLKVLGMKQQWPLFDAEYPRLVSSDPEIACYALSARWYHETSAPASDLSPRGVVLPPPEARAPAAGAAAAAGAASAGDAGTTPAPAGGDAGAAAAGDTPGARADTTQTARAMWSTGRDLPDACDPVFNALIAARKLTPEDVWTRVRAALALNNTEVAMGAAAYLPAAERPERKVLASIATNPQRYLERKAHDVRTRAGRETLTYAVLRLGRSAPPQAAAYWSKVEARFPEADRRYAWGALAVLGAQRLDPSTLDWFARAGRLDDNQLGWKARIALRDQRWNDVLAAIDAMSPAAARDEAWRYWRARALQATGHAAEARLILSGLSGEMDFYGQLASEDLGTRSVLPAPQYRPDAQAVAAVGALPGVQRALAFYRLNLRYEGNREWNWTARGLDDRGLLAAADYAQSNGLYDRAIYTAERTQRVHDFTLRYPTPYRDRLSVYTQQQQLDEAWVYGLIRQESRFVPEARSSAGASGLMQLMPRTASWAARKAGLAGYSGGNLEDVDTNLNLGTWYLRHVLDELDSHPLLASAAYNAGPRRAREWRGERPMEGAIYAETIPFRETREYVKKVMSNAAYYSQQLGLVLQSLRARLGVVAPTAPGGPPLDEPAG